MESNGFEPISPDVEASILPDKLTPRHKCKLDYCGWHPMYIGYFFRLLPLRIKTTNLSVGVGNEILPVRINVIKFAVGVEARN